MVWAKRSLLILFAVGLAVSALAAPREKPRPLQVNGVIVAISLEKRIVVIAGPEQNQVSLVVNERTVITKNEKPAKLGELVMGDMARAEFLKAPNDANYALRIDAKSPPPPPMVGGEIVAINHDAGTFDLRVFPPPGPGPTPGDEKRIMSFTTNERTEIVKNGEKAEFGDLAVGDKAQVIFVNTPDKALLALRIMAISPGEEVNHIRGKLVAFEDGIIILEFPDGKKISVRVGPDTRIVKLFRYVTPEELLVGDLIEAAFKRPPIEAPGGEAPIPTALSLVALPIRITAPIAEVTLEPPTITLKLPEGPIQFSVGPVTHIFVFGSPAPLDWVKPGGPAEVLFCQTLDGNVATLVQTPPPPEPPRPPDMPGPPPNRLK